MKGNKILLTFALLALCIICRGQASQSNVLQYAILTVGQDSINKSIRRQAAAMTKTAEEGNSMALAFTQIKQWEMQLNSYLINAAGYASTIKASTTLYAEAVETLRNLHDIKKAIAANPEGTVATLSMKNLYVEVTFEMIKTFRLLKAVAYNDGKDTETGVIIHHYDGDLLDKDGMPVGGFVATSDTIVNRNMLTGAERTQLLWELNDGLRVLNRKLRALAVSIAYYNRNDVWNHATAGMLDKSHADIAKDAKGRWRRAAKVHKILGH